MPREIDLGPAAGYINPKLIFSSSIPRGLANIFTEKLTYFSLCRPVSFCCNYSDLPSWHKSSHRQHCWAPMQCCSQRQPDWAQGSSLLSIAPSVIILSAIPKVCQATSSPKSRLREKQPHVFRDAQVSSQLVRGSDPHPTPPPPTLPQLPALSPHPTPLHPTSWRKKKEENRKGCWLLFKMTIWAHTFISAFSKIASQGLAPVVSCWFGESCWVKKGYHFS